MDVINLAHVYIHNAQGQEYLYTCQVCYKVYINTHRWIRIDRVLFLNALSFRSLAEGVKLFAMDSDGVR